MGEICEPLEGATEDCRMCGSGILGRAADRPANDRVPVIFKGRGDDLLDLLLGSQGEHVATTPAAGELGAEGPHDERPVAQLDEPLV